MNSIQHVLVVGGGVAGPILALFLKKAGIAASVYEACTGPSEAGGGLGLADNGMAVLQAAGVLERVQAVSVQTHEWAFENQRGHVLACMPGESKQNGPQPVMITRAALQQAVAEATLAEGIPMHYGKQLVAIEDTPGKPVVVHFADGSTAEGDLLVGADGIRSHVRQCILPDAPKPMYTGMLAPGGFSPCIDGANYGAGAKKRVHFLFGANGFFGYIEVLTAKGPRTMWWSTAEAPLRSREEMSRTTKADHQNQLLKLHGDWAQPVPRLIETAEDILDIAIHDVPSLPCWSAGRTVLIGDAAHAVAPHSGQGASMALEDAMLLAKLLRDFWGSDIREVFRAFEAERRPRTDRVIAMGRKNARHKQNTTPIAYWIQQQMMRIFVPLVRRKRETWLLDYKIDW